MSDPIDLDAARDTFDASTDFTVGIEEEFQILDATTLDLVDRYEELRHAADADALLAESVAGELIASEIEIRSGRGETHAEAVNKQREHRARLFRIAAEHGLALGATGTHPWADYREQRIIDTEHYRRLNDELRYAVWRNNTWSVHLHVGIAGADRAVAVTDRLRTHLPTLLAISANSPYLDGRDSGLHSARTQSFTRNFPRCGVPDVFGDWRTFADYVDVLQRTHSIVEYTQVWWSVRPHVSFGTVEVRICDAQTTAAEAEALSALILAVVAQCARDIDDGRPFDDPPPRMVEENMWRAIRYGQDGKLLDLDRLEEYPAAAASDRLLEWTAPMRAELDLDPVLPDRNGAQRQREQIAAGASAREVFEGTVRDTTTT